MLDDATLRTLQDLEEELLDPATGRNPERLGELLHEDFEEFGRSGKRYSRHAILAEFTGPNKPRRVTARDFQIRPVSAGVALVTYVTAHPGDGSVSRLTLRSSLWIFADNVWQLRFHQGTPLHDQA